MYCYKNMCSNVRGDEIPEEEFIKLLRVKEGFKEVTFDLGLSS